MIPPRLWYKRIVRRKSHHQSHSTFFAVLAKIQVLIMKLMVSKENTRKPSFLNIFRTGNYCPSGAPDVLERWLRRQLRRR